VFIDLGQAAEEIPAPAANVGGTESFIAPGQGARCARRIDQAQHGVTTGAVGQRMQPELKLQVRAAPFPERLGTHLHCLTGKGRLQVSKLQRPGPLNGSEFGVCRDIERGTRRSAAGSQMQLGVEQQSDARPLLDQLLEQQVGGGTGRIGRGWGCYIHVTVDRSAPGSSGSADIAALHRISVKAGDTCASTM